MIIPIFLIVARVRLRAEAYREGGGDQNLAHKRARKERTRPRNEVQSERQSGVTRRRYPNSRGDKGHKINTVERTQGGPRFSIRHQPRRLDAIENAHKRKRRTKGYDRQKIDRCDIEQCAVQIVRLGAQLNPHAIDRA